MMTEMIKKVLQSLPTKKKQKVFFNPPVHHDPNVFEFGKNHTIKIELKEEFSKRHIEFTLENVISLMSSMLVTTYSKNDLLEKDKQVKSLFLESKIKPIITIEKKQESFINPEDIEWHNIYWGSSGKGKSYFTKEIILVQIKFELAYYLETLLNFISENETSDKDLIQMNFQQDWERFLGYAQRALSKI